MITKNQNTTIHTPTITRNQREALHKHKSFCLWFTGLSGSDKSILAHATSILNTTLSF